MNTQLLIDPIVCEAHGLCAQVLPERIRLDEWGYPIIAGQIDDELLRHARAAVRDCPARALRMRQRA
ncbi:ferredoxin [Micrococcales bacterium 31B]|nr:ferredoxin [Micrococcales bacterium 31B]